MVALDARRSWFRYHQLFADLLQLELRRTAPGELAALHGAAAGWFAEHGYPVEAVRHAQAAQDWDLAARLLSDRFLGLVLDGQGATAHELLARFPADMVAADPELAALMAADKLLRGSLEAAERHLARAEQGMASVPADRRGRFQACWPSCGCPSPRDAVTCRPWWRRRSGCWPRRGRRRRLPSRRGWVRTCAR